MDILCNPLVVGEHVKDDTLGSLIEDLQDLSGSLWQEVCKNLTLRGEDVVVNLKARLVLLAHFPWQPCQQDASSLLLAHPRHHRKGDLSSSFLLPCPLLCPSSSCWPQQPASPPQREPRIRLQQLASP